MSVEWYRSRIRMWRRWQSSCMPTSTTRFVGSVVHALPWKVDAPNHGFMLRDGQRVVGAYLAFYSERLIAGRMERFCNLGAWYVLPEYRLPQRPAAEGAAGPAWLPFHRPVTQ